MSIVTGFAGPRTRLVTGRKDPVSGYVLVSGTMEVAFIHADQHKRIDELLAAFAKEKRYTARELMRALLNAEDFHSPIYDRIFRVYYDTEFAREKRPVEEVAAKWEPHLKRLAGVES